MGNFPPGYDDKGRALSSLTRRSPAQVNAVEFDYRYEVAQGGRAAFSKINIESFIESSNGGSAVGTFNLGSAINITSSITFNSPNITKRTFGKPVVSIYQGVGTAIDDQIYPIRGNNVTIGRYDVVGGEVDHANYDGTSDQWRAMIVDTNGTSSQAITFAANWIFIDYVKDSV